jgi:putative inorganic carbon (HCO3(-)) transporter
MISQISKSQTNKNVVIFTGLITALFTGVIFFTGYSIDINVKLIVSIFAGLVGIVIIVSDLSYCLYATLFLTYLNLPDILVKFNNFPRIIIYYFVGVAGVILFHMIYSRDKVVLGDVKRIATILSLHSLMVGSGLLYSNYFDETLDKFIDVMKNGILAVTIVLLLTDIKRYKISFWVLLISGLIMSGVANFQYLTGTFDFEYWGLAQLKTARINKGDEGFRSGGLVGDPNFYAQFLIYLIPLALNRIWFERNSILKVLAVVIFGSLILGVIFSYSRASFLVLALVLGILFLRKPPPIMGVILIVSLFIVMIPFIPQNYRERIGGITSLLTDTDIEASEDGAVRGRASEMLAAWNVFLDNPVFGVGEGNFRYYYPQYSEEVGLKPATEERSAHSLYFEILAENGFVGALIFLSIVFLTFLTINQAKSILLINEETELAEMVVSSGYGLAAYLINGLFLHQAFETYWWLMIAFAVGSWSVAKSVNLKTESRFSISENGLYS